MQLSTYKNKHTFLIPQAKPLTHGQFESVRAHLKLMSTSQLKALQAEIDQTLEPSEQPLLTHEEVELLSSLFR